MKYLPTLSGVVALLAGSFLAAPAVLAADAAETANDTRDNFSVTPYIGLGLDSFAAGNVKDYLNQGESGDIEQRFTAGFEFSYRLTGEKTTDTQLWVYGRTTHGVRSADVDCRANPDNPLCTPFTGELVDPTQRGLYILRNSSSLEGILGFRWEFRSLHFSDTASDSPARLYAGLQFGFVSVADGPDDVADVHHLAIGGIITQGVYEGSFLELGYGVNDLFIKNSDGRLKVNARVVKEFQGFAKRWGGFAQIAVDVDGSDGSDSIQTYLGLYFRTGS